MINSDETKILEKLDDSINGYLINSQLKNHLFFTTDVICLYIL